ncbi:hypothetical protein JCM33774_30130 [Actinophytocola sp. KF-1]
MGLLLGTVSAVTLGGWLVRTAAARAHTSGMAGVAPQTPSRDPEQLAPAVHTHAAAAEVNPVLLMAILLAEAYKPHHPLLERAWQALHRDAALGVANMHRRTYERTRPGRPFADRPWKDLPGDPELAIQAAAWHLHDLRAQLPAGPARFPSDELLAMGYNAGARNMTRFAHGRRPGPQSRAYLDRIREYWDRAEKAVTA